MRTLLFCQAACLALLSLLTTASAGEANFPYTDKATGLIFPAEIKNWVGISYDNFGRPELGVSYAYKRIKGGQGAITCYVYNPGVKEIPDGGEGSEEVVEEMKAVMGAIHQGWTQKGGTVKELLGLTAEKKSTALFSVHQIDHDGTTNVSVSVLTGYRNHFIKIRYTFPGNDVKEALEGMRQFCGGLNEANAETLKKPLLPTPPDDVTAKE